MLKIFRKETPPPVIQSNINSLLREGSDFFSNELILLNEKLSGNLFCAEKVIVEQNGALSGNITAKVCVISGTINGDILSTGQTEIKSTAVIQGNIRSPLINIQPGAIVNGYVTMTKDADTVVNLLDINILDKIKKHAAESRFAIETIAEPDTSAIVLQEKKQPKSSASVKAPANKPAQAKQQEQEEDINQKWW